MATETEYSKRRLTSFMLILAMVFATEAHEEVPSLHARLFYRKTHHKVPLILSKALKHVGRFLHAHPHEYTAEDELEDRYAFLSEVGAEEAEVEHPRTDPDHEDPYLLSDRELGEEDIEQNAERLIQELQTERKRKQRIKKLRDRIRFRRRKRHSNGNPIPSGISPLDLWGIHDLLLIGHKGPLVERDDASLSIVQHGALALAGIIQDIHPLASCRAELTSLGSKASLASKAAATWSCLGLSAVNFSDAYTSESDHFADVANTEPKFNAKLGACSGSEWPRGCSFWTSMHAMGVRADSLEISNEFMQSVLKIIAGGALYCFGCTSHFRFLNAHLLAPKLRTESNMIPY